MDAFKNARTGMLALARRAAAPPSSSLGMNRNAASETPALKRRRVEGESRSIEVGGDETTGGFEGRRTRSLSRRADDQAINPVDPAEIASAVEERQEEVYDPGKSNESVL